MRALVRNLLARVFGVFLCLSFSFLFSFFAWWLFVSFAASGFVRCACSERSVRLWRVRGDFRDLACCLLRRKGALFPCACRCLLFLLLLLPKCLLICWCGRELWHGLLMNKGRSGYLVCAWVCAITVVVKQTRYKTTQRGSVAQQIVNCQESVDSRKSESAVVERICSNFFED